MALAFLASLGWGCSDFLGGLRTRSLPLRTTVTGALLGGVLAASLGVALLGGGWPGSGFIVPGVLGGLASLVAFLTLYKALAIGSMSIVAPISAAYPVVPVIYGLARGERPAAVQLVGMALVLSGVLMASYVPSRDEEPAFVPAPDIAGAVAPPPHHVSGVNGASLLLAAVSALASGAALTGVSSASETSPYWGLVVLRGTALFCIVVYVAATRQGFGAPVATLPGLLVIGALDTVATGLFAVASTYGYLSVVSVIGSLFPLGTIALARLTLGERILPHQNAGVAVALTGVALVALG
ncbi:MAG TPA: DMT family transporter [Thermoleophilia bacterium]|nr:DMT family transporter [Thermoleophilia bacterium]